MTKGFYLHIPFCRRKCHYCNFYSSVRTELKTQFFEALSKEIAYKRHRYDDFFSDCRDATLYIGGGNPALLTEKELEKIFFLLRGLPISFEEVTIELNPEDFSLEKLKFIRSLGVNRLSLGIQSFCGNVLQFLGRNHNRKGSLVAIETAAKLFDNYSIDLIGGLSFVERDWELEFDIIKNFLPPHLSFYLLSVEEGTAFYGKIKVNEEQQHKEYFSFCEFAAANSYEHYEVSNFCRDGKYSRHNQLYWDGSDYLGFGPSAASFLSNKGLRLKNVADIDIYIKEPKFEETEVLTDRDRFMEALFLPLRTKDGVDLKSVAIKFPNLFARIEKHLKEMKAKGYLIDKGGRVIIPEERLLVMNEIVLNLVKEI
ncbi:MAG: radical SAM family heme chaperone HemW [bacterium]